MRLSKALRCAFPVIFFLLGSSCVSAKAQSSDPILTRVAEAQLHSLASRVGDKIRQSDLSDSPPKVLVVDFTWKSPETTSRLGTLLADGFSDLLKNYSNGLEVLDRKIFKNYLTDNWTSIADLRSTSVCLLVAENLGATGIIRANLIEDGDQQLKVSLQVAGFGPGWFDEARFLMTKDMKDMLSQPGPPYSREPDTIPSEPGVLVFDSEHADGIDPPSCISCTDAKYTNPARSAQIQGTVVMSVIVTANGDVASVYVLKGLPLGLTQSAIDAMKDWKLKPSMKNGQPVAVRVKIEETFRLL